MLFIIIDENLIFIPHIDYITSTCKKKACNRLTLFPDMWPDPAVRIFISLIQPKLEYGGIIWGHTTCTDKHYRLLEAAQESALMLILRAIKSNPTEALESELNIVPIDLRFEELQYMEAIKHLQKNNQFITNNMGKKSKKVNTFNF